MRQKIRPHLTFANVVSLFALFVALGGTTYAATGGNFILGQANTAASTTALSSGTNGPAFKVTNTGTGTGGSFNAASGHAPFTVNSGTKVVNLNADKLDGSDSSQLKGARAYAVSGWSGNCPDPPVSFCAIPRNKGVAYVVKVAEGRYCVGVNGISAADPKSVALVTPDGESYSSSWAAWLGTTNYACVSTEFEVATGIGNELNSFVEFTIVIP